MSQKHPSDRQLARWAEGGTGGRVANHAVECPFCERRLEAMTALEPRIREQLAASFEPSSTFEDRLRERLNQRLLNQETAEVLTDLVEVGPETVRLMLGTAGPDAEDRNAEERDDRHE